jgi:phytanoyl-CoA hydroxylase
MAVSALAAEFDDLGYVVVPDFVPRERCQSLIERADELMRAFDPSAHRSVFTTDEQQRHADAYFLQSAESINFFFEPGAWGDNGELVAPVEDVINKIGHAQHDLDPVFDSFSRSAELADLAVEMGMSDHVLLQSMYLCKQPRIGGEVGCHQDSTFLYTDPMTVTGWWFALEDATVTNGCLWAQPGGHRSNLRKVFKRQDAGGVQFEMLDSDPLPAPSELVPLEVTAGSLVMLHGQLPHWSDVNTSERSRHAYSIHSVSTAADYPAWNWIQRPTIPLRGFRADH